MNIKTYSAQDIYESHVYKVVEDENLEYTINLYFPNWLFKFNKLPIRVKIKQHSNGEINKDCVVINVESLWFDGEPIMLSLSSFDPEGRCYGSSYITNEEKYYELITYLYSLCDNPSIVINKDEKVLTTVQPDVSIYIQDVLEIT